MELCRRRITGFAGHGSAYSIGLNVGRRAFTQCFAAKRYGFDGATIPQGANLSGEHGEKPALALLEQKQLEVTYQSRGKAEPSGFILHPAGIVSRHAISYLIASVNDYQDLRQFALHRILSAEMLPAAAKTHESFNVDDYIREELNTGSTIKPVRLVADIAPHITWLLNETPLSDQQEITPIEGSDWSRLEATVPDDTETLWWVFSLGENMCVHEPSGWRDIIWQKMEQMQELYK